ncbi:hypothetical protein NliqN6_6027 [Naganishia liquefaciens]|uniref:Uncharacterized protein n=1 Tax=Naganishia liquefaciens TaxID=104408 RepID=A0A8H3TZB4_9TREE|nr:hypothetical protein NliqN6_6027 [Naganishia liquefaciens]
MSKDDIPASVRRWGRVAGLALAEEYFRQHGHSVSMALNWVQRDPQNDSRPLLLPGERIFETFKNAVVRIEIPPNLSGPKQEIKAEANMWLSNRRVVFLASDATPPANATLAESIYTAVHSYLGSTTAANDTTTSLKMESLTIPFLSMRDISFDQGLFTPNSLGLQFAPVEDGNFPQLGRNSFIKLNVTLKEGKVYEVWKTARELWQDNTRQRQEEDTLPRYTPQ